MTDPALPDASSLATRAGDAVSSAAKLVGKMARGAVESVTHDGATLVAKDASVGARLEAGLDLAADAATFVTGPEDVAIERAGVFAVKEGVERAPHLVEAGAALGKEAIAKAPEIAKLADTAFAETKNLLEKAGHELVNEEAAKGLIETKHAVYRVIEKGTAVDGFEIGAKFRDAYTKGKNFAVHAPELADDVISKIEKLGQSEEAASKGVKATLATSEMTIEKSIGEMERGHALRHGFKKAQEIGESVTKPIEMVTKLAGYGAGITLAAEHTELGREAATKLRHIGASVEHAAATTLHESERVVQSAGEHLESAAKSVGHAAADALHESEHIAEEAGKRLSSAAKSVADEVKTWSPDMPFEQFEKVMSRVRGSLGAPSHDAALSRAPSKQQGVER